MIGAMGPAEIARLRFELSRERNNVDGALGRALQLLDRFEAAWREQQRDERLSSAERASLGAVQ